MAIKTTTWMAGACALAAVGWVWAGTAPAAAAGPHDGAYRGTVKLVRSAVTNQGRANCGSTTAAGTPATRRVVDGKVTINYGDSDISFDVAADGTISGTSTYGRSPLTMNGKITGTSMTMDYGTQYCSFHFEGNR